MIKPTYPLKYSSYFVKKVMECANIAIYALDLTGRFMMINEAGAKICGLTVEELIDQHFSILFDSETLPRVSVAFNKTAFYGEVIEDFRTKIKRPTGEIREITFSVAPLIDNGKIIGVVGTAEDITERLKNEQALKAYSATLHTVLESIDAIVYVADMNTYEIVFANRNLKEFIGREDIEGKICWQVLQKGQTGPCPFCTNQFLIDELGNPKKESYEWEFQNTVTGRWLAIKDKAIRWIDGRLVRLEIAIDITNSKILLEEIASKEQKLKNILNTTSEGYFEVDSGSIIIDVNEAFCGMIGSKRDDILGASIYNFVDTDNAKHLRQQAELLSLSSHSGFNLTFRRSDGTDVHTRVHATAFKNTDGDMTGFFAFVTDITELLQIEGSVAKYASELERSNRELQEFAYIASHDLQEPLRKIIAFGDRLYAKSSSILDEQAKDYLRRMQESASRMQHFIDDLLKYSRLNTETRPFETVDLNVTVQEAMIDLDELVRKTNATVVIEELPSIDADPFQMRQLFFNLLSNALKFHKKDQTPFVKVSCRVFDDKIEIEVSDNGIGFDQRYIDKLFKPFSRLHGKSEYPGTGMGLAICDKIVRRHSGHISVSSELGVGSSFKVTLPVRQDKQLKIQQPM